MRRVRGRTTGGRRLRVRLPAPECLGAAARDPEPTPLLPHGIAPSESGAEQLWRSLHEHTAGVEVVTSAGEMPPPPWCAARVDVGAAVHPEALGWCGDLERCLAWAWMSGEQ